MTTKKVILPIMMTQVPMTQLDPTVITLRLHSRLLARGKVNADERNKNDPVGRLGRPRLLVRRPSSRQNGGIKLLQSEVCILKYLTLQSLVKFVWIWTATPIHVYWERSALKYMIGIVLSMYPPRIQRTGSGYAKRYQGKWTTIIRSQEKFTSLFYISVFMSTIWTTTCCAPCSIE